MTDVYCCNFPDFPYVPEAPSSPSNDAQSTDSSDGFVYSMGGYDQQEEASMMCYFTPDPLMNLKSTMAANLEVLGGENYQVSCARTQHAATKKMKGTLPYGETEPDRVVRRRTKNREAAQASRMRKKIRLETLEAQVAEQKKKTADILVERDQLHMENQTLRAEIEYMKEALTRVSMADCESFLAPTQFVPSDLLA